MPSRGSAGNRQSAIGFTLIELLVVISIMGTIAALTVPALKNLGKANIQASGTRQLLDDIGRARQFAIGQHTTVYMVFVPTNFFNLTCVYNGTVYNSTVPPAVPSLLTGINAMTSVADRQAALTTLTNLVDKQLTGYNFISYGQVGDQPGQHSWRYLSTWQAMPEGTFVAATKFLPQYHSTSIPMWQQASLGKIDSWFRFGATLYSQIYGFTNYNYYPGGSINSSFNYIPFPTEHSPGVPPLPYIAFDHTGKLVSEMDGQGNCHHAYIPLAQGTVSFGRDVNKQPTLAPLGPTAIAENPPGNSTNIGYSIIDIDPLSGRAKVLSYHMP